MQNPALTLLTTVVPTALVGYLIYILTKYTNKLDQLERWKLNLLQLNSVLIANNEALSRLLKLDVKLYFRYFSSVLDKFNGHKPSFDNWEDYKGPLVFFEKLLTLPILNEYLLKKFEASLDGHEIIGKITKIDPKSSKEKIDFIVENKIMAVSYDAINTGVLSFNENASYYRDLTKRLVSTSNDLRPNVVYLLNYSLYNLVETGKELKTGLDLLSNTFVKTKEDIDNEIKKVKADIRNANTFFIVALIVISIIFWA